MKSASTSSLLQNSANNRDSFPKSVSPVVLRSHPSDICRVDRWDRHDGYPSTRLRTLSITFWHPALAVWHYITIHLFHLALNFDREKFDFVSKDWIKLQTSLRDQPSCVVEFLHKLIPRKTSSAICCMVSILEVLIKRNFRSRADHEGPDAE